MRRAFVYLFLSMLLFTLTSSCKKYPDGPCISLRTKEKRINGYYIINNYLIDGADSVAKFQVLSSAGAMYNYYFEADRDRIISGGGCAGDWDFYDHKRSMLIGVNYIPPAAPYTIPNAFVNTMSNVWRILRLTNSDFWLKATINNKTYEIKFKKSS